MKILGIDTSTRMLSLALTDKDKVIFSYKKEAGRKHCVVLLKVLNDLLDKYRIKKEDIGLFAVGLGPGSFTGLRISLSILKGLVLSLEKKAIGISSLDVIAGNINQDGYLSVVLDARRGNVYTASYEYKSDKLKRITPYLLINFNDWLKGIKKKTFVLGDGISVYNRELLKEENIICLPEKFWYPDAKNLCALAREKFKKHGPDNVERLLPLYLYPKECQIKRVG
ncbi:MAG: tRNA (adenosine(37)-N6)-threonylcarbamoyltransferase complex dimerization subunit type 1 TsaB [Candidatus Omnitrophota bacterium]|nr:tRNA (adenosine(37)-N6)-threonylcarbamoyltransferase complex dimerization subunit type 1 TsaB [Candidatus Omnitrophota bacterium]